MATASTSSPGGRPDDTWPSAETIRGHVAALVAPALRGRRSGTDGERAAAEYVLGTLDRLGVGGLPPDGRRTHRFVLGQRGAKPTAGPSTPAVAATPLAPLPPADGRHGITALGFIAGAEEPLRRELVVLAAHIDHLGERGGVVFPGADDNASGVGVVLEVARVLQRRRAELGRSVVLAFFGDEEDGMVGSRALLAERIVEPKSVAFMVNVDMVGRRLSDRSGLGLPMMALGIDPTRSVAVLGTKAHPSLRSVVKQACLGADLDAVLAEELPRPVALIVEAISAGRADNASFERLGIPALFFSSGESDDYHEPTDVAAKLDPGLMARRARAVAETVLALSKLAPLSVGPPSK